MPIAQQHLKNIPKSFVTSLSGPAWVRRSVTAAFRNWSCNDFQASCCCQLVDLVRQGVILGVFSACTCGTESRDPSWASLWSSERRGGRGAPRHTATCGSFLVTTRALPQTGEVSTALNTWLGMERQGRCWPKLARPRAGREWPMPPLPPRHRLEMRGWVVLSWRNLSSVNPIQIRKPIQEGLEHQNWDSDCQETRQVLSTLLNQGLL